MRNASLRSFLALGATLLPLLALVGSPVEPPPAESFAPKVAAASDEGRLAMKRFRMPAGVQAELFAAEPLLANPVSFCFDEKGRCYVAETFRLHHGVTDNRGHMNWLDDDLASRTVADRVALYRKHLKDKFAESETEHDRVRLLEDTKGTGVADRSTVFADGFHHAEDGIGAGVLARKGNVYYTCIPDLWLLRDTKGAGKADEKRALSTGYGVHVAFLGHDLHGLRMGPDGKLYFSIGDRGFNVKTKEGKTLFNPDSGAVLRCDPDGSNLEVVATGLRNPQELAFDQYGNLFTVDNNSDSGDKARLVYVVEGGDSGWRTGYQYGSDLGDRGPFNAEKIWHLPHDGQPAYIVPPLAHITSGPSGLCYNYGATALPERYAEHFFICDFHGSSGGSGVYSFAVKPKGAAFEVADGHEFIWSILATDCEFGPDGGFYISDWVEGWNLTGKGRIYRFKDPEAAKKPAVAEVKKLLAEGFDKRSNEELAKLLEHPDMRVRQEAQFALAEKGKQAIPTLAGVAEKCKNRLARLHALWGLGQIGGKGEDVQGAIRPLLKDGDTEVRAQACRVLGWVKGVEAIELLPLLKDAEPRVRFQTLTSLAKPASICFREGDAERLWQAVVELLKENADRDAYLRHAAALVMARYPGQTLVNCATDESPAVRLAAVLALRQRKNSVAWPFLNDPDPRIAVEAARLIHDETPDGSQQELAARLNRPKQSEFFTVRALNANFRLGEPKNAAALAAFAGRADAPEKLRIEAVKLLGDWAKPARRDHVTGLTQSLPPRDPAIAADALRPALGGIFSGPDKLRQEAAKVATKLGIKEVGPALLALLGDAKVSATVRAEAIKALAGLKDERLPQAMKLALADSDPRVRTEGLRVLAKADPTGGMSALQAALEHGGTVERQGALSILRDTKTPAADEMLARWLDKLLQKAVPAEVQLDLLEAAARHPGTAIKDKLNRFEAARSKSDHLAKYRETLAGGDAEAGRKIFFQKAEVSCVKCHKVKGEGGDVGPDLAGIGTRQNREYILESIVEPNRQIAKGFETVVITTTKGLALVGVLKSEDAKEVRLMTAEGKLIVVAKKDIDDRQTGKSAMPDDVLKFLSKTELRDLVEFLAGLK